MTDPIVLEARIEQAACAERLQAQGTDPYLTEDFRDGIERAARIAVGMLAPRTITTVEELESLPIGVIVRAVEVHIKGRSIGRIFENVGGRYAWLELDPGDRSDGEATWPGDWLIKHFTGRITVLYTPEPVNPPLVNQGGSHG